MQTKESISKEQTEFPIEELPFRIKCGSFVQEAEDVYQSWLKGDVSRAMPIGMFAPRMPVQGNLVFC